MNIILKGHSDYDLIYNSPIVQFYQEEVFSHNNKFIFFVIEEACFVEYYEKQKKYMESNGYSNSDWVLISINYKDSISYENWINCDNFLENELHRISGKSIERTWTRGYKEKMKYKRREWDFLCFNKYPRAHRDLFARELIRRDLWETNLISYHHPIKKYEDFTPRAIDCPFDDVIYKNDDFSNFGAPEWNTDKNDVVIPDEINFTIPFQLLENVFYWVVTETYFGGFDYHCDKIHDIKNHHSKHLQITEKTLKAVVSCPFIVLGGAGTLKYLKEYGYKTHPHMFDESYDDILSDRERFKMVISEIEKFRELSHDDKKENLRISLDNIVYNQKLLFSKDFFNTKNKFMTSKIGKLI